MASVAESLRLARHLYDSIENGDIKKSEELLNAGANPNLLLPEGITPFHLAIGSADITAKKLVSLILKRGGNPNVRTSDGLTPVHICAVWGKAQLLGILLENGGNPRVINEDGSTAIDLAIENQQHEIVKVLLKHEKLRLSSNAVTLNDIFLVKKTKDASYVLPKVSLFSDPTCCQKLPVEENCCSIPSENSFRLRNLSGNSDSLTIGSWHLERHSPDENKNVNFPSDEKDHFAAETKGTRLSLTSCSSSPDQKENHSTKGKENDTDCISQLENSKAPLDVVSETRFSCSVTEDATASPYITCEDESNQFNSTVLLASRLTSEIPSLDSSNSSVTIARKSLTTIQNNYNISEDLFNDDDDDDNDDNENQNETSILLPIATSSPTSVMNSTFLKNTLTDTKLIASLEETFDLNVCANSSYSGIKDAKLRNPDLTYLSPCVKRTHLPSDKKPGNGRYVMDSDTDDFLYTDEEEQITLFEQHHPTVTSIGSITNRIHNLSFSEDISEDETIIYNWRSYSGSLYSSTMNTNTIGTNSSCLPDDVERLNNSQIRARLICLGKQPGPVTFSTRGVYLNMLQGLQKLPIARKRLHFHKNTSALTYSKELVQMFDDKCNFGAMRRLEESLCYSFDTPSRTQRWREGSTKNCFTYLLLDPRVTRNLPVRSSDLSKKETLKTFVASVFYVGKGKRTRPYSHLYEAAHYLQRPIGRMNDKVRQILDIWSSGGGVVSLHCFQNVIPVEAYTREACMVDAIGLENLCNMKRGDYYGPAVAWSNEKRRYFGAYLLYSSLNIFLHEGERQIRPADI